MTADDYLARVRALITEAALELADDAYGDLLTALVDELDERFDEAAIGTGSDPESEDDG